MKRDFNRAQLPGASAWNLLDLIPDELGAPLRGRGGWALGDSGAMTSVTSIKGLVYAPFTAGAKSYAIGQNSELWRFDSGPTDVGAAIIPAQNPIYYRGKIIIPNNDGTTAPKYYDGTTLGNLAGTAPNGMFAGSFADHAYLARDSTNIGRIWFSAAGDPTSWNTSSGYVDADGGALTAVVPLKTMILAFHADSMDRFRGSIPPPGTDFVQDKGFFSFGCLDAFSVARWNDRVIFANAKGIFMTDGAGWQDLTARAGMSTYWQTTLASYTTSWRLGAGVYRNHYILSVNNGTSVVDAFCINLNTGAFLRFSNFHGNTFLPVATGGVEELYMGLANGGRVGKVSTCWNPSATVKKDGDATTITPTWETSMHMGYDRLHRRWISSYGMQRWRYLYYAMQLTDYASDAPTVTLSYTTDPTPTGAYTAISRTVAATSKFKGEGRRAITTGNLSPWIGFKVAQTGPGDLQIHELALAYEALERGALPQ